MKTAWANAEKTATPRNWREIIQLLEELHQSGAPFTAFPIKDRLNDLYVMALKARN